VPALKTYQPVLFSILAELTLPFSKQPVWVMSSGSKSSMAPPPSVVPKMGPSAQMGMAVLQSGEFCATIAIGVSRAQHRARIRALIEWGGYGCSMTFITPSGPDLVYFTPKKRTLNRQKGPWPYRLREKWDCRYLASVRPPFPDL